MNAHLIFSVLVGVGAFWLVYWYLEVYTPRKHMREAIAEVNAMFPHGFGRSTPASAPRFPLPPKARVLRDKRVAVKKTPGRVARVPHA